MEKLPEQKWIVYKTLSAENEPPCLIPLFFSEDGVIYKFTQKVVYFSHCGVDKSIYRIQMIIQDGDRKCHHHKFSCKKEKLRCDLNDEINFLRKIAPNISSFLTAKKMESEE